MRFLFIPALSLCFFLATLLGTWAVALALNRIPFVDLNYDDVFSADNRLGFTRLSM